MIKIFHKNAEIFNKNISKTIAERQKAYISFSQEKEDFFLSFSQGKNKQDFCATIGMATFYKIKRKQPAQEEIILTKEIALKKFLYCNFAFAKKMYTEKQNQENIFMIAHLFADSFRKFVRLKVLKSKIKKINNESSLGHLMKKNDLLLCLL